MPRTKRSQAETQSSAKLIKDLSPYGSQMVAIIRAIAIMEGRAAPSDEEIKAMSLHRRFADTRELIQKHMKVRDGYVGLPTSQVVALQLHLRESEPALADAFIEQLRSKRGPRSRHPAVAALTEQISKPGMYKSPLYGDKWDAIDDAWRKFWTSPTGPAHTPEPAPLPVNGSVEQVYQAARSQLVLDRVNKVNAVLAGLDDSIVREVMAALEPA